MRYKILALLLLIYSATFAQKFTLDASCEPVQIDNIIMSFSCEVFMNILTLT